MKNLYSFLALILICAGLFCLAIGYTQSEIADVPIDGLEDLEPIQQPSDGDSGDGDSGDSSPPPDYDQQPPPKYGPGSRRSVYIPILNIMLSELELIGFILCVVGVLFAVGGKL